MTISAAELDRRFDDHCQAARQAVGGRILKGSAYYGEGLEDEGVREKVKAKCKANGIRGQFVSGMYGGSWGLRLWMGSEHGTD